MSITNLSLANPISVFLNKPNNDFKRKDFIKIIEQKRIECITFHYTAIDGRLKELKLPVSNTEHAERILADGERVDGSSLFKGIVDAFLSDLYIVPEYKTAFLNPFDEGSLDFICRYMTKDGNLAPFAPDNILAKARKFFCGKTGLDIKAMGELEFCILSKRDQISYPVGSQKAYHESAPFVKNGEILDEMVRYITRITGAVKYSHSEVGFIDNIESEMDEINGMQAEQHELEFIPTNVQEMADALVLARWIIRNVAYKHGCIATFTPKLEEGVAGNGFHFHIELVKDGRNIMLDSNGKLSGAAFRLIGGLCEYAGSLTAFGNTAASSYLRLVPDQEAPTRICWSDLNRSVLIRVPLGWANLNNLAKKINPQEDSDVVDTQCRQTVELRSPDGSAYVHLLMAGIVMAAEWAFETGRSLELAEKLYVKGDNFENNDILGSLPSSCKESGQNLIDRRNLYERENIFPASVIDYFARSLIKEEIIPIDFNRPSNIKKIMHKDLHKH